METTMNGFEALVKKLLEKYKEFFNSALAWAAYIHSNESSRNLSAEASRAIGQLREQFWAIRSANNKDFLALRDGILLFALHGQFLDSEGADIGASVVRVCLDENNFFFHCLKALEASTELQLGNVRKSDVKQLLPLFAEKLAQPAAPASNRKAVERAQMAYQALVEWVEKGEFPRRPKHRDRVPAFKLPAPPQQKGKEHITPPPPTAAISVVSANQPKTAQELASDVVISLDLESDLNELVLPEPEIAVSADPKSALVAEIERLEKEEETAARVRKYVDAQKIADQLITKRQELEALEAAEAALQLLAPSRADLESQLAAAREDQVSAQNYEELKKANAKIKQIEADLASIPVEPDPKNAELEAKKTQLADAQRRETELWGGNLSDPEVEAAIGRVEVEIQKLSAEIQALESRKAVVLVPAPQAQVPKPAAIQAQPIPAASPAPVLAEHPEGTFTTAHGSNGHAKIVSAPEAPAKVSTTGGAIVTAPVPAKPKPVSVKAEAAPAVPVETKTVPPASATTETQKSAPTTQEIVQRLKDIAAHPQANSGEQKIAKEWALEAPSKDPAFMVKMMIVQAKIHDGNKPSGVPRWTF